MPVLAAPLLGVVLLSMTLAPPFGEASATTVLSDASTVTVELSVDVLETTSLVLMRGFDVSGAELGPIAMIARADGTWGVVVELPARPDLRIVFEMVVPSGGSVLSEASSLVQLGVDPELLTGGPPATSAGSGSGATSLAWVLVAVAAALGALALLALWARLGRRDDASAAETAAEGDVDADVTPKE